MTIASAYMRTLEPTEHAIASGRAHCPRQSGPVSVQTCWTCEWLIGFDVDGETETVRCAADPRGDERDPTRPMKIAL